MSPNLVTRCPNCGTSFKVTEEQLNAADGAVRCGSCLQVFQGLGHLLGDRSDDELFLESPDTPVTTASTEEDNSSKPRFNYALGDEEAREAWTDTTMIGSYSPAFYELDPASLGVGSVSQKSAFPEQVEPEKVNAVEFDGGWTKALDFQPLEIVVAEEQDQNVVETGLLVEHQQENLEPLFPPTVRELVSEEPGQLPETIIGDAPAEELSYETDVPPGYEDESSPLGGFTGRIKVGDEDPHEIVGNYIPEKKQFQVLWFCLTCCAMLALGSQFIWFNKDILSQNILLRPYYVMLCNSLDCELPEFSDITALAASDLVVRTHPDVEDALIVDAIVRNEGAFRQRFPQLLLSFSDMNNEIVAAREFSPEEYLKGELTGLIFFPANTEVRLSLEIVDPGEQALGYTMAVQSN